MSAETISEAERLGPFGSIINEVPDLQFHIGWHLLFTLPSEIQHRIGKSNLKNMYSKELLSLNEDNYRGFGSTAPEISPFYFGLF